MGSDRPAETSESKAIDEYFDGKLPRLTEFEQCPQPGGYFIKA